MSEDGPTKGAATRERIRRAAGELFDDRGYFGTGMNDILARAEAPKGSAYFHFPGGKEELAVGAVQTITQDVGALLVEALAAASSPQEAVRSVVALFADRLVETDFQCGCPVSAVGLEVSGSGSEVSAACRQAYSEWISILADHLRGHDLDGDADELADQLFCIVQGALLVSRVTGDVAHMAVAERLCTDLVAPSPTDR